MAEAYAWACLLLPWIITGTYAETPDLQVTCLFSEDCVLPCSFKPAGDEVIDWHRQEVLVHSFLQGSDQLDQQHPHYADRTSLFKDQVAHGNASLRLRRCGPQDRGRYRCRVHSAEEEHESFVIVKVEAPIRSLSLEMSRLSGYEEVKCSTRDVYPAPHVSWSTQPPTPPNTLKPATRKMADKLGLYTVESRLKRQGHRSDLTYICTVNSSYGSQTWRASLREREINTIEGHELAIPCTAPASLQNFTLTWSFTRADEPTLILTYDSRTRHTSNRWESRARLDPLRAQAGDGSLWLHDPDRLAHTGTYTCAFSAPQDTHLVHTGVNVTALIATPLCADKLPGKRVSMEDSPKWWVAAVVIAVLAITMAAVVGILKLRADCTQSDKNIEEATEMQPVKDTAKDDGVPPESSHLTDQTDGHTS